FRGVVVEGRLGGLEGVLGLGHGLLGGEARRLLLHLVRRRGVLGGLDRRLGLGQRLLGLHLRLLDLGVHHVERRLLAVHGGVGGVAAGLRVVAVVQVASGVALQLGGVEGVLGLGQLLLLHRRAGGGEGLGVLQALLGVLDGGRVRLQGGGDLLLHRRQVLLG